MIPIHINTGCKKTSFVYFSGIKPAVGEIVCHPKQPVDVKILEVRHRISRPVAWYESVLYRIDCVGKDLGKRNG